MPLEASTISVVIPCYNRAALVGDTLQNLLDQSLPPHEIIVVDDGSTDGSAEVVASFGGKVKLIRQANAGPGPARNVGFEASTGRFIQFFDSDDLASRNKLEVQAEALQKNSDADFAYAPWVRAKIERTQLTFDGPVMQAGPVPDWKPMLEWQMGSWCLVFQNCLFRRGVIERAGRFRSDLMPTEDSEFLVRILLAGARPVFTRDCLVFYRVHDQHQITGSGTSARRRCDDWTRYFDIIGGKVETLVERMHPSTRREIALIIHRHLRSCRQLGCTEPQVDGVFRRIENSLPQLQLRAADFLERLSRKLKRMPGATPNSLGLVLRPPGTLEHLLAVATGFQVHPALSSDRTSRG